MRANNLTCRAAVCGGDEDDSDPLPRSDSCERRAACDPPDNLTPAHWLVLSKLL